MKLLLTSAGLTNESISKALFELVGKDPQDTIITFIPTAMNVEEGDKGWYANNLNEILKHDVKELEIADISALPEKIWLPKMQKADVLFFSGGNCFHLLHWIEKSGLKERLYDLLETKVYVGISAGSMVTNPTLFLGEEDRAVYYEKTYGHKINKKALGFVDFYVRPHMNSEFFLHASADNIEKATKDAELPVYGLDDQSAIQVVDGDVRVISEGEWKKFYIKK